MFFSSYLADSPRPLPLTMFDARDKGMVTDPGIALSKEKN
jgi:hypothetical protein